MNRKYKFSKLFAAAGLASFLIGCAPIRMEVDGPAMVDSSTFEVGSMLVVPANRSLDHCIPSMETCLIFQRNLASNLGAQGVGDAWVYPAARHGEGFASVNSALEAARAEGADYVVFWNPGLSEDNAPFSFGSDKFSVSELKVIRAATGEIVWSLGREYSLAGPNTEGVDVLARDAAKELASLIRQSAM